MPWIPMNKNLIGHPKILRLVHLTKLSKETIIGYAYVLWDYGDTHADEQGRLRWHTLDHIIAVIGSREIVAALCDREVNWLEVHEDHILLPGWDKYNSKSAKRRLQNTRDVARLRNAGTMPQRPASAQSIQGARAVRPPKPTEYL